MAFKMSARILPNLSASDTLVSAVETVSGGVPTTRAEGLASPTTLRFQECEGIPMQTRAARQSAWWVNFATSKFFQVHFRLRPSISTSITTVSVSAGFRKAALAT